MYTHWKRNDYKIAKIFNSKIVTHYLTVTQCLSVQNNQLISLHFVIVDSLFNLDEILDLKMGIEIASQIFNNNNYLRLFNLGRDLLVETSVSIS